MNIPSLAASLAMGDTDSSGQLEVGLDVDTDTKNDPIYKLNVAVSTSTLLMDHNNKFCSVASQML